MNKKNIKLNFAPGCFDQFEGSQEDLDELIAEIKRMAESGELLEKSKPMDEDSEDYKEIFKNSTRNLQ